MNNAWQRAAARAQFCTKALAADFCQLRFTTVGAGTIPAVVEQLLIGVATDKFKSLKKESAVANHRGSAPAPAWWLPIGARRRRLAKTPVPAPRPSGIELVDVHTRVAHRVSPEELLAGRARGDYEALCGVRLLAASLTDPGRGQCPECAS